MDFNLENVVVGEGAVLLLGVRYAGLEQTFTYAALHVGGRWYLTGTGRVPQDAGWGAVRRWYTSGGRTLVWVRTVTETPLVWSRSEAS
jgi:hypothetical protein